MAQIGIIGYGVVGKATAEGFKTGGHEILFHDKFKESDSLEKVVSGSQFIFICVPTPTLPNYVGIDLRIVNEVVDQVVSAVKNSHTEPKKIVVIKSTVVPGTTATLAAKYPDISFAANPEFLRENKSDWDFMHPDRTIIGANDQSVAEELKKLHLTFLPQDAKFFLTDPTTAEFAKYMSNVMLAAKTMIANEFYTLARALEINYDSAREMVEADPRIGSHIKVPGPDGDMGFGGKCFPKDMVALLALGRNLGVDLSVLEKIWEKNLKIREKHDWIEIEGAVSKSPDA